MLRRDFSAVLLGAAALPALPGIALAQGSAPVEGKQYRRLGQALPTPPGKIEVTEFFWYGCPHCYAFDPALEDWVKSLPADVSFRRLHVGEGFPAMVKLHQKLFFALEAMGVEGRVHQGVFNAFHVQRLDLTDEASIVDMVGKLGVDTAKFRSAFNSFGVQSKAMQANKLSTDYRLDGVPALTIGGRYVTSPGMASSDHPGISEVAMGPYALTTADYLIKLVRNNKG